MNLDRRAFIAGLLASVAARPPLIAEGASFVSTTYNIALPATIERADLLVCLMTRAKRPDACWPQMPEGWSLHYQDNQFAAFYKMETYSGPPVKSLTVLSAKETAPI